MSIKQVILGVPGVPPPSFYPFSPGHRRRILNGLWIRVEMNWIRIRHSSKNRGTDLTVKENRIRISIRPLEEQPGSDPMKFTQNLFSFKDGIFIINDNFGINIKRQVLF